ncbi:hypothetical protein [Aliikangiella maris]|uniref:Uncharacterized protein n=2 Tax=Aliikangiella maris TaxID=3162458 RepID=A0ABV2BVW1_9GAMM
MREIMKNKLLNSFVCALLALVPVTLLGVWEIINQPQVLENGLVDDSAERSLFMFWHLYLVIFLRCFGF